MTPEEQAEVNHLRSEIERLRRRTHEIQERADKVISEIRKETWEIQHSYHFGNEWLRRFGMGAIAKYGPTVAIYAVANLVRERDELASATNGLIEALAADDNRFPEAFDAAHKALAGVTPLPPIAIKPEVPE